MERTASRFMQHGRISGYEKRDEDTLFYYSFKRAMTFDFFLLFLTSQMQRYVYFCNRCTINFSTLMMTMMTTNETKV